MEPPTRTSPVLSARRVPKRARKIPKDTPLGKGVGNFLILLAFAGGLLLTQILGAAAGLALALLSAALLVVLYLTRWARRREGTLPPKSGIL